MKTTPQQGLTLTALLAALASVSLLTVLALPMVQARTAKNRLSEAVQATTDCRERVAGRYASGPMPAEIGWGCTRPGGHVKDLMADQSGQVHVRLQGMDDAALEDKVLILVPYDDRATPKNPAMSAHWGRGVQRWVCTVSGAEGIPADRLPQECRG